jgi:hypothetical protein
VLGRLLRLTGIDSFITENRGAGLVIERERNGKLRSVSGDRPTAFRVVDRGRGRIAFQTKDGTYASVSGEGIAGEVTVIGQTRQCGNAAVGGTSAGDTLSLSPATHRYIVGPKNPEAVAADHPGPSDRRDGLLSPGGSSVNERKKEI